MTTTPLSTKPYVEQRDNGYWIAETRVSLDSVVHAFLNGESPESMPRTFRCCL